MQKVLQKVGLLAAVAALSSVSFAAPSAKGCEKGKSPLCTAPAASVPEVDAAGAGLALALTVGVVAIARERRRHG